MDRRKVKQTIEKEGYDREPIPYNPMIYGNNCMTVDDFRHLQFLSYQKGIDVAAHDHEKQVEHQIAIETAKKREQLAEKQMQRKEELRANRELISFELAEGEDGTLQRQLKMPDGRITNVKNVCTVTHLRMTEYFAVGMKSSLYAISWDGGVTPLILSDSDATAEKLLVKLARHGCVFHISRRYSKELGINLFALLKKTSKRVELPCLYGWNRMSDEKWFFAGRGELTYDSAFLRSE